MNSFNIRAERTEVYLADLFLMGYFEKKPYHLTIRSHMSFFLVFFSILSLSYGYVGWRSTAPFPTLGVRLAIWIFIALQIALPFAAFTMRFRDWHPFCRPLINWLAFLGMGVMSILFVLFLVRDAAWICHSAVMLLIRTVSASPILDAIQNSATKAAFARNSTLAVFGLAALMSLYGFYGAWKTPTVKHVTIPLRRCPPGLANMRIVQITDLHVGPTIGESFVRRVTERVNSLDPDIIVITGDVGDGNPSRLENATKPLGTLRARHGVYFVTGNHEYYSGVKRWVAEAERLGMRVLTNEHVIIEHDSARLLLAGVPDYNNSHFTPADASDPLRAIADAPAHDASLLLAHQPRSIYSASEAGFDAVITGHTHGGQYIPWNHFVRLQQPYVHGLHEHDGTMLYISRGTGYWGPPFRIGVPSEITLIHFTSR